MCGVFSLTIETREPKRPRWDFSQNFWQFQTVANSRSDRPDRGTGGRAHHGDPTALSATRPWPIRAHRPTATRWSIFPTSRRLSLNNAHRAYASRAQKHWPQTRPDQRSRSRPPADTLVLLSCARHNNIYLLNYWFSQTGRKHYFVADE